MLGVWRGANDPNPEKFTATKPWRRPRPTLGCGDSKGEEETIIYHAHIPTELEYTGRRMGHST
jgi:hypothetical protein